MAYSVAGRNKACFPIVATIVVFIFFSVPCPSFSAQSIYTIQIGSFLGEHGSMQEYGSALKVLKEEDRTSLRIRKVGKYYAVRLGVFEQRGEEAERLFRRVKNSYPGAILLPVNFSKEGLVKIYDSTAVAGALQSKIELPIAAAVGTLDSAPGEAVIYKSEVLAEDKALEQGHNARVTVKESPPFISDGLLIGFATIVSLFMLELYLRNLARLGTFESLKWILVGSAAAEWNAEKKQVELPDVGEELRVLFAPGPEVSFVCNNIGLADDPLGELGYDAAVIETGDETESIVEETAKRQQETPENVACPPVLPRTMPLKSPVDTAPETEPKPVTTERENRVGRAVLAVSFFAED